LIRVRARCLGGTVAAAAAATAVVACGGDSGGPTTVFAPLPPRAPLLDCGQRVEGAPLRADPNRDLVIGPFAYYRFRENVDGARLQYDEEHRSPDIKIVALVETGRDVTLAVPEAERDYMTLLYTDRGTVPAVRLQACRRQHTRRAALRECHFKPYRACLGASTQFAGGIRIDFARAKGRERCAVLEVWNRGRTARAHIFEGSADCR
jgi:hypothetical protein